MLGCGRIVEEERDEDMASVQNENTDHGDGGANTFLKIKKC
jgi:hypothetical protein